MTYDGLPFLDIAYPAPGVYLSYVSDVMNVWDTVYTFFHLSKMLCPWILFLNNGLDEIQWASFILDLQIKLKIISRRVSSIVIVMPCGVSGRG